VKKTGVFEWHQLFRVSQKNVKDVGKSGSQNHAHLMKVMNMYGILCVQSQTVFQAYCVEISISLHKAIYPKGLTLRSALASFIMKTVQFTKCTLAHSLW
jgi:hypothetical protein